MKNWKTTLAGIIGSVGTYLAAQPEYHQYGVAMLILAPALLGYCAQDASNKPTTSPAAIDTTKIPGWPNNAPLIAVALACLVSLAGCAQIEAWTQSAKGEQVLHTAADLEAVAVNLGENFLLSTAAQQIDTATSNAYIDGAAASLASFKGFNVTGEQVYAVTQTALKALGSKPATNAAQAAQTAFLAAPTLSTDTKIQAIADGLTASKK